MPTAAIYARISQDATGEAAGVSRQQSDCERYCAQQGWTVAAVLVDNDISASRYSTKSRPAYAQALAMVDSGQADAIVAWHLDRLWRQPRELEDLIDMAEKGTVTVATLNGDIDLRTGDGRFQARILVSVAAKSSDDASRRLKARYDSDAANGLPHGPRAFGYQPGGMDVDPIEAAIVRQAAMDVLAGVGLTTIARRWNEQGVRPPQRAKEWWAASVRSILLSPRNVGLRVHRGDVVGPAAWAPIMDRATWEQVRSVLTDPARRRVGGGRTEWTGLIHCGRADCGSRLYRRMRGSGQAYVCMNQPGRPGCGRVYVSAAALERTVLERVFAAVDRLDVHPARSDDGAEGDLEAVEAKAVELADMYAAGELDRADWLRARQGLDERRRRAYGLIAGRREKVAAMRWAGRGADLAEAWDDLDVGEKHQILAGLVDRVVVLPTERRGCRFDVDRVKIDWAA